MKIEHLAYFAPQDLNMQQAIEEAAQAAQTGEMVGLMLVWVNANNEYFRVVSECFRTNAQLAQNVSHALYSSFFDGFAATTEMCAGNVLAFPRRA